MNDEVRSMKEQRIKHLWDMEALVIFETEKTIKEVENLAVDEVRKITKERDALEIELWGNTRVKILSQTNIDPLTNKTMQDIIQDVKHEVIKKAFNPSMN